MVFIEASTFKLKIFLSFAQNRSLCIDSYYKMSTDKYLYLQPFAFHVIIDFPFFLLLQELALEFVKDIAFEEEAICTFYRRFSSSFIPSIRCYRNTCADGLMTGLASISGFYILLKLPFQRILLQFLDSLIDNLSARFVVELL